MYYFPCIFGFVVALGRHAHEVKDDEDKNVFYA